MSGNCHEFPYPEDIRKRARFGTFSGQWYVQNLYNYYLGHFPDIFRIYIFHRGGASDFTDSSVIYYKVIYVIFLKNIFLQILPSEKREKRKSTVDKINKGSNDYIIIHKT